jgi:hypothetical protein
MIISSGNKKESRIYENINLPQDSKNSRILTNRIEVSSKTKKRR